ncbi:hypothetical protein C8T65DRAFT_736352 [Cerioporus squamosus]|nr:hypothetical protein C8T65DRAFT_736352 [Cerioporus squamosus]
MRRNASPASKALLACLFFATCKPSTPEDLYFSIGHDDIIDLISVWFNVLKPLKLDSFPREKLADLCFLFGGVGDVTYFHRYTLLPVAEIRRYMGSDVVNPQSKRAQDLAHSRSLKFNIFLPARSKLPPSKVHAPHNLVAFFGLLLYLHRVGYPSHWLSDFLSRVLSGSMLSDVAPYLGVYPIPSRSALDACNRTGSKPLSLPRTTRYPSPSPAHYLTTSVTVHNPSDIAIWEAHVRPAEHYLTEVMFDPAISPYDPRTHLLFFRSDVIRARDLIGSLPHILEGKASPAPGSFFILTAQEHVQYETTVRFRLSRRRMEKMRKQQWSSMVAYQNDTGHQATLPVAIENWTLFRSDGVDFEEVPSESARRTVYERTLEELD